MSCPDCHGSGMLIRWLGRRARIYPRVPCPRCGGVLVLVETAQSSERYAAMHGITITGPES
jgi:ssDNA-binding Zn-finger/Zn-ribbon topoisomerase 1